MIHAKGAHITIRQNKVVYGLAFLLAMTVGGGCGGSKGQKNGGDDAANKEVVVEGRVSLRGSTPFTLLLLEAKDGKHYMIESSRVAEELKRLEGMDLVVTAKVLPEVQGETPALSVKRYDLLPLPTGERPIIGVVYSQGRDGVYLRARDEVLWLIKGDFGPVLASYGGATVWVVGDRLRQSSPMDRDLKEIFVTQYGVIKE
ncbi:MAG: hypothetical protein JSW50_04630 [Candidatus Latescibacterota bacterium]|nr:MAG: hypothetical protein JSW50_04630 [Candidatus Latescibacterota bacterium]